MDDFLSGRMDAVTYKLLEEKAREDRREQKRTRKKKSRSPIRRKEADLEFSINVADLKRRIFNPQVSRENVIKALEALPPKEKTETIAGFPPGLRRRLEEYLKGKGIEGAS